jgi:hypothetical protein
MGLIDELMGSVGGEVAKQMSSSLGIDKNIAAQLIPQVAPLILGGLKRQSEQRGGQPRVDHILNKYGKADVLDDIGGLLTNRAKDSNPDPRLGGLLGESGVQASDTIAKQFNLSKSAAMKIIPMLAPIILGFLTKKRDTDGAGSSGIEALLDQDGDGSVLDDVAGFLLKGLGGGGSQQQSSGGLLGGLLGKLFGGGRR